MGGGFTRAAPRPARPESSLDLDRIWWWGWGWGAARASASANSYSSGRRYYHRLCYTVCGGFIHSRRKSEIRGSGSVCGWSRYSGMFYVDAIDLSYEYEYGFVVSDWRFAPDSLCCSIEWYALLLRSLAASDLARRNRV